MPASSLAACKNACKPPMPFLKSRSGGRLRKRCAFLTGKERDSESSNDYFGARYYWNGSARWLSTDPIPGDYSIPRTHNRYAYVINDPVNLVDPDGGQVMVASCPEWTLYGSPGDSLLLGRKYCTIWFLNIGNGAVESGGSTSWDAVPGEDFTRRRLKQFQDKVKAFKKDNEDRLSDCEMMAGVFDLAAGSFSDNDDFVAAVTDSLTNYGDWVGGDGPDYVQFNDSGFRPRYQESGPEDKTNPYWRNQVRHFTGGFFYSYLGASGDSTPGAMISPLLGALVANILHEPWGKNGRGDRNLNWLSFDLAGRFYRGEIKASDIGKYIRENICSSSRSERTGRGH